MPRLFLCATGQDTGGWNWRIKAGFGRHAPEWTVRAMAATQTYLAYPRDLPFRRQLALELYAQADVVHLHNTVAGWERYDQGAGKPAVLQHHGTMFREDHARIAAQARAAGMVQIASTVDLTLLEPGVEWVPVPYHLEALQLLRERLHEPSEVVRIAHAPTNRRVKGTEHFLAVVAALQRKYPRRVQLDLIEGVSHAECLRRKAQADVFYDQLELGYGCNAVEAWGMGMPVVAGVADPRAARAMLLRWGQWPFLRADPGTLSEALEQLVVSVAARAEYAQRGHEHVQRWHDERVVVPLLAQVFGTAPRTAPGPITAGMPRAPRAERRDSAARALQRALERRARLRMAGGA